MRIFILAVSMCQSSDHVGVTVSSRQSISKAIMQGSELPELQP